MRIAQVVASYYPKIGGVEANARHLAQGCVQAGDQVTVFTHQFEDSPADEIIDGVRVLRFPLVTTARNYQASPMLFRSLKQKSDQFDVVHAHSYHTLMGHAAMRTQLPFIYTPHYHGTGHSLFRVLLHKIYRSTGKRQFRMANVIICNSDAERSLLIKDFPWIDTKLTTILPGTDAIPATRSVNRLEQVEPTVLVVGRLERYKNVDLVIDAFRQLAIPASLVIVGNGPDRERLERHTGTPDPKRPIMFTGRISDERLQELFGRANVVVAASDHEAFGLSVAEGLAAGAHVLASAIPAHAEIARKVGTEGAITLTDVRDTQGLAKHLEHLLLVRPETSEKLNLPSWTDFVEEMRGVYARLCASRQPFADKRIYQDV